MSRPTVDYSARIMSLLGYRRPKKKGSEILVRCLNPSHEDRNASMTIRCDGVFICRSCGFKGNWKKLEALGFPPLEPDGVSWTPKPLPPAPPPKLPEIPEDSEPWDHGPWRGTSKETLVRLGARLWRDDFGMYRIFFPFLQNGKLVGGSGRLLDISHPHTRSANETVKDALARCVAWYAKTPKWRHLSAPTGGVLHGIDDVPEGAVVVLTESVSSALPLLDAGIPTLAILGAQWTRGKRELLLARRPSAVLLAFDGDDAGRNVTRAVQADLCGSVNVWRVPVDDRKDPADMGPAWVEQLRSDVESLAAQAPTPMVAAP